MKNIISLLITIILLSACELQSPFAKSKEQNALIKQELDAKISQEKEKLQVHKELELAKIDSSLQKDKLLVQNTKEENQIKLNLQKLKQENEIQKYYILLAIFILVLIFTSLYIYFNNRRKDKLRAYEDNLEKYFKEKENQAKVQITNKIIDTIASHKLSSLQENKLIESLGTSSIKASQELDSIEDEDIYELEIIEDKEKEKKTQKIKLKDSSKKDKKKEKKLEKIKKEKKKEKV